MSLSKHVKHSRRCILMTRQFTESTATRDARTNPTAVAGKISREIGVLNNVKMSMQSHWKFLTQLKDYLTKSGYDKNLQLIVNREWVEYFQKLTYSQIESVRKYSATENSSDANSSDSRSKKLEKRETEEVPKAVVTTIAQESTVLYPRQGVEQHSLNPAEINSKSILKDQIYSFLQVLPDFFPRLSPKVKESTAAVEPKWKTNIYSNVSKHSIASRTRHVLNSIATAESNASKWRRIEDLLQHIDRYPEARHYAIKEGAIRILLGVRRQIKDEHILGSIREALAVLGHVDPLPGRGIRILSIDGGGMRGVLVIEMLKKLEELTGKKIYELFDYICGVSTGAILAASLGGHRRKSLDEISMIYKELSTKVFTQNALRGTSSLVWSHAYYDTSLWEGMLQENLGFQDLIQTTREQNAPKISTISTVVNHQRVMAYVFRNYTLPHRVESQYMGSYRHKLWEAVRASAAAPSYFEEFKHGGFLHQDGGIMVNNPCAVAIHEAKQLWPNNPIQCVVSFGTGRTPYNVSGCEGDEKDVASASSWKDKFFKILDSATDTEAVHTMLNDLLPDHIYYRFNPYLTEMLTMVEIRPDKIAQLEHDASMYIRRNEEKFKQASKALLEKRNIAQKAVDWIILQKQILGL